MFSSKRVLTPTERRSRETFRIIAGVLLVAVALWTVLHTLHFSSHSWLGGAIHLGGGSTQSKHAAESRKLEEDSTPKIPIELSVIPAASSPSRPPMTEKRFQELHARPALAKRLGKPSDYPHIKWPRYKENALPMPTTKEELDRGRVNPFVVLLYKGSFWGMSWTPRVLPCAVPCILTSSEVPLLQGRPDVHIFHGPGGISDMNKPPGVLYAMHSMESEGYYTSQRKDSAHFKITDIQMTTKMTPQREGIIHVPCPYANNHEYSNYTKVRPAMLNKTHLALFMHNNCNARSRRESVVKHLIKTGLEVNATGSCMRNADARGLNPVDNVARFMFYLSFENVFNDTDWVSSTFFRVLDSGSVPVYLGAPNILKYAPGERSIIRACDFDSAEDLVDYLHELARRPKAYREYLSWKLDGGPSPEFKSVTAMHDTSVWCSMCIQTGLKKGYKYDAETTEKVKAHMERLEQFEQLNARLDAERSIPCRGNLGWLRNVSHGY